MDNYEREKMFTKRYKKLKELVKIVYGYDSFRPKQYEIINRIIEGQDICAVLPTGYGKSLTFQIPALYLDKPAIIVCPLISLMDDQRLILDNLGITSCCYNSTVSDKLQMRKDILNGKYSFVYIAPESITKLQDFLIELEKIRGISLVAIDEAHCISSYGFDFRPSYRELSFIKKILPNIPILAVTATATKIVASDICRVLGYVRENIIKTSFNRPNLYLEVRRKTTQESLKQLTKNTASKFSSPIAYDLIPIIRQHPNESIIIYCISKKDTARVAEVLEQYGIKTGIYHANISVELKSQTHLDFINNKLQVVVATIAFGMGINKADVRAVIHYGAAKSLEGYYQEIGRAGRDGNKSYCYTFYSTADFMSQRRMIAECSNIAYRQTQEKLLRDIELYLTTRQCRRKILLEYFDEDFKNGCDACDNCCPRTTNTTEIVNLTTVQNVENEAKMLLDLIGSIHDKNYGLGMYIDILRGSASKRITSNLQKNELFGKGKHRSINWWKELGKNLMDRKFLRQIYVRGKISKPVIAVTPDGVMWANMYGLNGILGDKVTFDAVTMTTTI